MAELLGQSGLTGLDESSQAPIQYGVFQNVAQTPDMDLMNLQNVYGLESMPVFEWVRTVQTGERSFNPAASSEELKQQTQQKIKEYEKILEKTGGTPPAGMMTPEELERQMIVGSTAQIGSEIASKAASVLTDPYIPGEGMDKLSIKTMFSETPTSMVSDAASEGYKLSLEANQIFQPELASAEVAKATGNLDVFNNLKAARTGKSGQIDLQKALDAGYRFDGGKLIAPESISSNLTASTITQATDAPGYFETATSKLYGTPAAAQNWSSAASGAFVNFGIQLAMGEDPKKAAKSAGGAAIGKALGTAFLSGILGPFGGVVGSALGGMLGGRVICNELMKQGVMTRKQVVLDYRFTRDYLTPQHVNGYHCWAVWMVKQMRKGKFVKFWKHVAGHRANEIAYIYGERSKPDYLGKVYRRILEPTCWVIGAFKKESDWSILYKQKEI